MVGRSSKCVFICSFLIASICSAQFGDRISSVRGEVVSDDPLIGQHLSVELCEAQGHRVIARSPLESDGSFEFRDIPRGDYMVRISNQYGGTIQQEMVQIHSNAAPIRLRLSSSRTVQRHRPAAGTVTVRELQRNVPKKAAKAFQEAQRYSAEGDIPKAMEHLGKALRIFPDYAEAHSNMGFQYMRQQRIAEAADCFQRAVNLDPASALFNSNLAVALLALGKKEEGEAAARRAIQLDNNHTRAHYALGAVLMNRPGEEDEALKHLAKAVADVPRAHLLMAQIYSKTGREEDAARELRAYVKTGETEFREKAEKWLSEYDGALAAK